MLSVRACRSSVEGEACGLSSRSRYFLGIRRICLRHFPTTVCMLIIDVSAWNSAEGQGDGWVEGCFLIPLFPAKSTNKESQIHRAIALESVPRHPFPKGIPWSSGSRRSASDPRQAMLDHHPLPVHPPDSCDQADTFPWRIGISSFENGEMGDASRRIPFTQLGTLCVRPWSTLSSHGTSSGRHCPSVHSVLSEKCTESPQLFPLGTALPSTTNYHFGPKGRCPWSWMDVIGLQD